MEVENGYAHQSGCHGGMEYAVGCMLLWPRYDTLSRFGIRYAPDTLVIAFHQERTLNVKYPAEKLLNLRDEQLLSYIMESNEFKQQDIKGSLAAGFRKMDERLREAVLEINSEDLPLHVETLWRACYNSTVIIIHKKTVYLAGAARADVVLCRGKAEFFLTSGKHIGFGAANKFAWTYCREDWNNERFNANDYHCHPDVFFYNEEGVEDGDMLVLFNEVSISVGSVKEGMRKGGIEKALDYASAKGAGAIVRFHGLNKRHHRMPPEYFEATSNVAPAKA